MGFAPCVGEMEKALAARVAPTEPLYFYFSDFGKENGWGEGWELALCIVFCVG
jgi:hypothetical protein